ncbi:MAG: NADH:flavin oxidoreductase [Chloroflexi bacterium]|nr:NADH:flavin oxidoreductase [Chloroflexota bacterium]
MIDLFTPFRIKGLELRNRFMRSATYDRMADDRGRVTDASVALYRCLAEGGVGLIVTGHTFISPQGQAGVRQYGIYSDEVIPGLRHLTEVVHAAGGKIAVQISHAGINSRFLASQGITALAPSLKEDSQIPHREMTQEEVEATIADYGSAAARAREAGFDAVQLHGAHGFLMSQFLSALFNRRADRWGGSPENRRRFHIQVVKEVRHRIGQDYPILMKFGVMDDQGGGTTLEDGLEAARGMVAAGLDALEVSGGVGSRPTRAVPAGISEEEPYFRERTIAVKKAVSVPVMEVGGIRSLAMAQAIVDSGEADMVSLSRPLIREPGLIARWQWESQAPARCISCSRCFRVMEREGFLGCYRELHPDATD